MTSLKVYPDLIQGTDEWLEQRRGIVTASVVGKLISQRAMNAIEYGCPACNAGVGQHCRSKVRRNGEEGAPIKTPHAERTAVSVMQRDSSPLILETATGDDASNLTALLVAERITGWVDPQYVSDDMLRGIDDEPRAVAVYSEHYSPVTTIGFMVREINGLRIGYSPDGLVGDHGLIEVKSRRAKKQLQLILDDDVPTEHMAQLQCGLLVSGREWIDYVSFSGGLPLWVRRVFPDKHWHAAIVAAVEQFEKNAAEMVATYERAVKGLPMTERVVEMEMVI